MLACTVSKCPCVAGARDCAAVVSRAYAAADVVLIISRSVITWLVQVSRDSGLCVCVCVCVRSIHNHLARHACDDDDGDVIAIVVNRRRRFVRPSRFAHGEQVNVPMAPAAKRYATARFRYFWWLYTSTLTSGFDFRRGFPISVLIISAAI